MERVLLSLEELALTAHGDVKLLGPGYPGFFRLRVSDLRVYFNVSLPESKIIVTGLEKRSEAYKGKSRRR